jgi:hypothetical protein
MRVMFMLTILALALATFILMTGRAQPQAAPMRVAVPRRRVAPELTASAAAERWYDEV